MHGGAPIDIAIVASARYPIRRPFAGGLEVQTYRLANALRERGHRVRLFASADSDAALGVEPVLAEAHQVEFSELARTDPSMLAHTFLRTHHAYLSLTSRLAQDPELDLVHNHSLHYLPVAMAPSLPVPTITTLHTPPTAWLESARALVADEPDVHFVSVSHANAAAWGGDPPVLDVVPNGVPIDAWPYSHDPVPGSVCWAGRIVPEKGLDLALDAIRRTGRHLTIAGPIGDHEHFERDIAPRIGDDVTYVGHVDAPRLAQLFGASEVFVATPRWEEPFGLVVAEALSCGTPIAAFDRGALAEIVDPTTGILAPPDDVEELARAVEAAAQLDRTHCRLRAEEHCSMDRMVDRYEQLYEKVLG